MFRCIRPVLLGLAVLLGGLQSSRADVVLQFTQVGPAMENPYPGPGAPFPNTMLGELFLVVTDEAYASGMTLSQSNGGGPPHAFLDGVIAIHVALRNIFQEFAASLSDFTKDIPIQSTERSSIQISSAPGGLPVGSLFYSSPIDMSVRFTFDGTDRVTAHAMGDFNCFRGCDFGGVLTVSVPEPAAILTFGLGLLILGVGCARRRASGRGPVGIA